EKLANCYRRSLALAAGNGVRTIAFPAISTGIFGFPLKLAAETLLTAVWQYLSQKSEIETVTFILFDIESFNVFKDQLSILEKGGI
ncbi:MAG TPA: hypothetical protein EYQ03_01375, partial [Nitrospinaceae bacterium]|nr:hypothetical protein [Nitrospinaceae bacterium]